MRRKTFWIAAILVAIPIAWICWIHGSAWRESSRITRSRQNLKQIGLALHSYHDKYNYFPPTYVLGPDGKPWHSWRVLLLPFLGEQQLYERYRFDEPWNGSQNSKLMSLRPDVYHSLLQKSTSANVTTYLAVVSRRSMWPMDTCVRIIDVTDGTSNTIFLIENRTSDIAWSEPREMREADALAQLRSADQPTKGVPVPKIPILLVDGAVRVITPQINRDIFIGLLTPSFGKLMTRSRAGDEQTGSRLPDVVDIGQFPHTRAAATPDLELLDGESAIYCATMQLAWDQLRPTATEPVVVSPSTPVSEFLNVHPFPLDSLAPNAYFVGVGGLDPGNSAVVGTTAAMLDRFRHRFPSAPVELLKSPDDLPGVRILAYLEKSLPFVDVMDKIAVPMTFNDGLHQSAVHSFGWQSSTGEGSERTVLADTVEVLDYTSKDDFILKLRTDGPERDEIFLAKIAPKATLQATWESVTTRIHVPAAGKVISELRAVDALEIPVLSFGFVANIKELIGLGVPLPKKPLRYIHDVRESIRFRLDEFGAELIADTQMVVGENGDGALHIAKNPLQPRHMILDRPFLLALKEQKAVVPYFLAWIGNAELMELAK